MATTLTDLDARVGKLESKAQRAEEDITAIGDTVSTTLHEVKRLGRRMGRVEGRLERMEGRMEQGFAILAAALGVTMPPPVKAEDQAPRDAGEDGELDWDE